ncbi:MAG: GNAT family N-acetyltransferase [Cyanobacteria bacterium P01_D01_bin.71]
MQTTKLDFQPINLDQERDLCIQFRADAFVCSFGSAGQFYQEDGRGAEKYLQWLEQRMQEIPNSCVHVWQEDQIIGQIEMGRWNRDTSVGYVNLFYLIPTCRSQGLGKQLDRHAAQFFQSLSCYSARLNVSPQNITAVKFYLKQGWMDLGPREDAPEVHFFEKTIERN